jgi:phenylacetic acid degradation operon negative regulatory protein
MKDLKLTPLYEILIHLEENGQIDGRTIKNWGEAVSRGVIGKMEAMNLVDKTSDEDGIAIYRLSEDGYKYLNNVLNSLHKPVSHWDKKWRIVWFSIPEKDRPLRDKFRRELESLGMRPVLNGVWMSPFAILDDVANIARGFSISSQILLTESDNIDGISSQDIVSNWDFSSTREMYENFILKAENLFLRKDLSRVELKTLILEYAMVVNREPRLPIELFPNDWPKFRATLLYKKAKRLIS